MADRAARASLLFLSRRHPPAAAGVSSSYSFPSFASPCPAFSLSPLPSVSPLPLVLPALPPPPLRVSLPSSFLSFSSHHSLSSSFSSSFSSSPSLRLPSACILQWYSCCSPAAASCGVCTKQLVRSKTDARYKGKRCMSPTAGALPAEAAKISLFEKQKRAMEAWLAAEQQRVHALPVQELREAAAARVLLAYKQRLEQLYGSSYVQREWDELFLLAKASLLEAPKKVT